MIVSLDPQRIQRAKRSFTTRRVPTEAMRLVLAGDLAPRCGDLVLAKVGALGHHNRIEQPDGRRAALYGGDEILVCYGNRYAPDQFEAEIGTDLGPCHLVAAGGIASTALSWNDRIGQPTEITPLGLVGDGSGTPINLKSYALSPRPDMPRIPLIAVVGTAMNAGKTTTAANLVRGLVMAGHRVGTVKLTGTGAGGDLWIMRDAGAHEVVDFTDAGFSATYRTDVGELEHAAGTLVGHLAASGCTVAVAEIADGLYQQETAALLRSPLVNDLIDGVLFAAGDSMGAAAGARWLRTHGHTILGLSGLVTRSPLAVREAEQSTGLRCISIRDLRDRDTASGLVRQPDVSRRAAG